MMGVLTLRQESMGTGLDCYKDGKRVGSAAILETGAVNREVLTGTGKLPGGVSLHFRKENDGFTLCTHEAGKGLSKPVLKIVSNILIPSDVISLLDEISSTAPDRGAARKPKRAAKTQPPGP